MLECAGQLFGGSCALPRWQGRARASLTASPPANATVADQFRSGMGVMALLIDACHLTAYYPTAEPREGEGTMGERPEYAIAVSYTEFICWRAEDPKRRARVTFMSTPERAEGREPGTVHRIGNWKESPAWRAAKELEAGA
jgi:hypothetical protein